MDLSDLICDDSIKQEYSAEEEDPGCWEDVNVSIDDIKQEGKVYSFGLFILFI